MSVELVTMLEEALNMFAFLAVELTVLFLAISYLVGCCRSTFLLTGFKRH